MHDSPSATVQWRRRSSKLERRRCGDRLARKRRRGDHCRKAPRPQHQQRRGDGARRCRKPERRRGDQVARKAAAHYSVIAPTLSLMGLRVVRTAPTPDQLPRRSRARNNKRAERREGAECASGCVVRAEAPQAERPERPKGEQSHEVHCWCYRLDRRSQEGWGDA